MIYFCCRRNCNNTKTNLLCICNWCNLCAHAWMYFLHYSVPAMVARHARLARLDRSMHKIHLVAIQVAVVGFKNVSDMSHSKGRVSSRSVYWAGLFSDNSGLFFGSTSLLEWIHTQNRISPVSWSISAGGPEKNWKQLPSTTVNASS